MPRQREPLRDEPTLGIGEPGRVIRVVLEHARIGRAEHGQRHLVGDPEQRILEQLEFDRIADHRRSFAAGPGIPAQDGGPIKHRRKPLFPS